MKGAISIPKPKVQIQIKRSTKPLATKPWTQKYIGPNRNAQSQERPVLSSKVAVNWRFSAWFAIADETRSDFGSFI
ncbi:hypothetical protein GCM10007927_09140 [Sulfitobacter pacificus]|uniref:Uncharacterized protein n=1 Tax=Sulfitobacter pacificus TaxID=1499314 RepID=A0ABQ5VGA4_9RHOB|nr:hypothetical protein GCM10007927_09140 [Sulfitobacter pacificus]